MYIPEYLYHYTTIQTAKLILDNRTIRFNNLSKTDDIDESMTTDVGVAGKYIFVSCWTDIAEENIALWSMYSNGFKGIRIRMRYNPFKNTFENGIQSQGNVGVHRDPVTTDEKPFIQIIPHEHLSNGKYACVTPIIDRDKSFEKCIVRYTNNERILYPKIYRQEGVRVIYDLGKVGVYKKKAWEYQREVRYRIYAVPLKIYDFLKNGDTLNKTVLDALDHMIKNEELPISNIDLHIDEEAFKDMEIMIGPQVCEEVREDFIEYVKIKNPSCIITSSSLNMRKHI